MTCQFFRGLSCSEQGAILEAKGVLLTVRNNSVFSITLYQVDSFYVEAYFIEEEDRLVGFKCFETTACLEPYLSNIDISHLIASI
jgi:hypothetical protein